MPQPTFSSPVFTSTLSEGRRLNSSSASDGRFRILKPHRTICRALVGIKNRSLGLYFYESFHSMSRASEADLRTKLTSHSILADA